MRLAALSVACILFLASEARKFIIPFEVLLFQADEIVTGKVLEVHSNSYTFQISHSVYKAKKQVIKVQHFREWTCDKRIKKLEVGQKLLLLVEKKASKYAPLNASSGEIFVINDKISVRGVYEDIVFDEQTILSAISDALNCYKLKHSLDKSWYYIPTMKRTKSDEKVDFIRNKSTYSKLIFDAIDRHILMMIEE